MQQNKSRKIKGFSLTDSIIAALILALGIAGTANFKYFAVRDAIRADRQTTAARTALFFCEAWRGVSGDETFDPSVYLNDIVTLSTGSFSNVPAGYNLLGTYDLIVENQAQNVTLSWKDMNPDLRALHVVVAYNKDSQEANELSSPDAAFNLTTYCLR